MSMQRKEKQSAFCDLSGFVIDGKSNMQSVISDFLEKSFFSCRQRKIDFSGGSFNSSLQYIFFDSVFSLYLDSSGWCFISSSGLDGVLLS